MKFQFANRASSHLAAPLAIDATAMTLTPGSGERFPAATADAPAQLTIVSVNGASEIVQCFDRSGDVLQIHRAQEGSPVSAFAEGSLVELRLTAGVLQSFLTTAGGTMLGTLEMAGNAIVNANLYGAPYIDYVKTNITLPPDANFAGSIQFLNGGIQPRVNGFSLLTTWFLSQAIFLWWGRLDQLPAHLKLCDGTLGTPDLRGRFPFGSYDDSEIGSFGGQFRASTEAVGNHSHGGADVVQTLDANNLPPVVFNINQSSIYLKPDAIAPSQREGYRDPFVTKLSVTTGYGAGRVHAHGINPDGAHGHFFTAIPPFLRLYFVMFRNLQLN